MTGVVRLWMVFALALGLGLVNAFDMPGRQTFVLEMVGRDRLTNAVSLNSIVMNTGRLLGPAVAGAVIATWGLGVCFLANAASYLGAIAALLTMRRHELLVGPRTERRRGQLVEGLRYVWSTPALRVPLLLMIAIGTLTYEFQVSLPLLAKDTFGTGAAGYGLLQSAMSLGAIVGGLGLAARARPTHRRLGLAAVGFGLATGALALAPGYGTALVLLVVVGAASIMFITLANSTLQLTADPAMRSRVIALYGVAFLGSTPIGGPIVGWVGQVLGARWSLALGAAAALVAAAACWRSLARQHVLEPAPDRDGSPRTWSRPRWTRAARRPRPHPPRPRPEQRAGRPAQASPAAPGGGGGATDPGGGGGATAPGGGGGSGGGGGAGVDPGGGGGAPAPGGGGGAAAPGGGGAAAPPGGGGAASAGAGASWLWRARSMMPPPSAWARSSPRIRSRCSSAPSISCPDSRAQVSAPRSRSSASACLREWDSSMDCWPLATVSFTDWASWLAPFLTLSRNPTARPPSHGGRVPASRRGRWPPADTGDLTLSPRGSIPGW